MWLSAAGEDLPNSITFFESHNKNFSLFPDCHRAILAAG
jgi:hypothetical protein